MVSRVRVWIICAVVSTVGALHLPSPVHAASYKIDAEHTSVSFKIRHLVSKVQGTFNTFEGTFEYEPGTPDAWNVTAVIQADSIDTGVAERDKHLRSDDFFDVAQFATINFHSTRVTGATDLGAQVHGLLTIHGVTKSVVLDLEIHGVGTDPWGNVRSGFTATTQINRKDFGLAWNQPLETGGVLVGEQVTITLEVEGIVLH